MEKADNLSALLRVAQPFPLEGETYDLFLQISTKHAGRIQPKT